MDNLFSQNTNEPQNFQNGEWVTLRSCASITEMDDLCLCLLSNGIIVRTHDQYAETQNFLFMNTSSGYNVFVLKSSQKEAYAIMKNWEKESFLTSIHCPACHSQHVVYVNEQKEKSNLYYSIMIFIFGVFFIFFTSNRVKIKCLDCGHNWKERQKT